MRLKGREVQKTESCVRTRVCARACARALVHMRVCARVCVHACGHMRGCARPCVCVCGGDEWNLTCVM